MQANITAILPAPQAKADKAPAPKGGEPKADFTAQLSAQREALQKSGEGSPRKEGRGKAPKPREGQLQEELNVAAAPLPVGVPIVDVVVLEDQVVHEAMALPEGQPQIGDPVGILERSGDTDVPDAQMPKVPLTFEEAVAAQEAPADETQMQEEINPAHAKARMPENDASANEQLKSPVTILQTSGSLENADETQIPPPSRIVVENGANGSAHATRGDAAQAATQRPVAQGKEQSAPDLSLAFSQTNTQIPQETGNAENAPAAPFEQIAMEATLQAGLGKNSFVMKLNPEELGEVTVRLILHQDGVVARISASNETARTAISEQLIQLGESMREKGIDVRSVELAQEPMGHMAFLQDGRQGQGQQSLPRWKAHHFIPGALDEAEGIAEYESYLNGQIGTEVSGVEMDA